MLEWSPFICSLFVTDDRFSFLRSGSIMNMKALSRLDF